MSILQTIRQSSISRYRPGVNLRSGTSITLIAVLATIAGCQTIPPVRSYKPVLKEQEGLSYVQTCDQARVNKNVEKAIVCAGSMAHEFSLAAEALARDRQRFRYTEIGMSAVMLGLAGFEADIDALKAMGLATGTTEVTKSSQQFAERIAALDTGSARFRCAHEKGQKARDTLASSEIARERILSHFSDRRTSKRNTKSMANLYSVARLDNSLSILKSDNRSIDHVAELIMTTVSTIEMKAVQSFRFSTITEPAASTISKAIDDALKAGENKEEKNEIAKSTFGMLEDRTLDILTENMIEIESDHEKAMIALAACAVV